ncbi:hypothetical protein [Nostoc sp.]
MARIKITELHQKENQLYLEISEHESYLIVGGINPQPLPPAVRIARQPEFRGLFIAR